MRSRQRIEAELNRLTDENARLQRENASLRQKHGYEDRIKTENFADRQESLSINHNSDTEKRSSSSEVFSAGVKTSTQFAGTITREGQVTHQPAATNGIRSCAASQK